MAIEIAERVGAEIISVDSMQVYKGMDIGTAKPTMLERRRIVHHLIDVVEPEDEFSVAQFRRIGRAVIQGADSPVVEVGGSGLHFRALVDPMSFAPTDESLRSELASRRLDVLVTELLRVDPGAGAHVDLANKRRVIRAVEIFRLTGESPSARAVSAEADELRRYVPQVEFDAVGVDPGGAIDDRIDRRLGEMRAGGLVDEVAALHGRFGRTAGSAVGYREIVDYLENRCGLEESFTAIRRNTRKLARRQQTWFQRDPRIRWIPWIEDESERVERAMEIFE
jgi:tRNA dimethylallyltransferase